MINSAITKRRLSPGALLEIFALLLWTLWVGKAYLIFDPNLWPLGWEFGMTVRTHFIWTNLFQCGACMFWNGSVQGGAPAFAELQGSVLHPFVILTTLIAGVVNGSKLVLLASLFTAGLAQWWLAKSLRVGQLARMWSAGMAVVGGHLAARMELGVVGVVLSTAMCSLAIASTVDLALNSRRRSAILLGIILAMTIVSGQSYMQIGFLVSVVPALAIFLFDFKQSRVKPVWKEFLLAAGVALLLSGVFLIPLLHFLPNIDKPRDPLFGAAQSLAFIPLNLVINDLAFYMSTALKPTPYPNLYVDYLGWIPILLALLSVYYKPRNSRRWLGFFLLAIGLTYLAASADTFRWLAPIFPSATDVRFPSYIAGLANPLILGLAACGLDGLLKIKLPRLALLNPDPSNPHNFVLNINTTVLLLLVPLLVALLSAYDFSQNWLITAPAPVQLDEITQAMQTDSTEWIDVPLGDHYWNISAIGMGLKLGSPASPWSWKGRTPPPAAIEATRDTAVLGSTNLLLSINDINIVMHPENEYAFVQSGALKVACKAQARGGYIDVVCPAGSPAGTMTVMENNWTGWTAQRDGVMTPLLEGNWLSVDAPAGQHTYAFRYRPWDVWVGLGLTLIGMAFCIVLWIRAGKRSNSNEQ